MTVWGITRSYNERDVIESSIRRMCAQVDHVIVGDNSNDGTEAILARLLDEGLPLTVKWDDAPSYRQREVMTEYAHFARQQGAEWGVFFDIDEAWLAAYGTISHTLTSLPSHMLIAPARNLSYTASDRDDPADPDPMHRIGWRKAEVLPLMKIAARLRPDLHIDHGNHAATYTTERTPAAALDVVVSRHYPYRTPEQFIKRIAHSWPEMRDSGLPDSQAAHIWAFGRHLDEFGEAGLRRWFDNEMIARDPESRTDLVFDPLPPIGMHS